MYKGLDPKDIEQLIESGESSKVEFKEDSVHNLRIAMELAAFVNFKGGVILLGVSDEGKIRGLTRKDNEERVMNICSSLIEPRIIPEYETVTINGKKIALITVDTGKEKPYAVSKKGHWHYYIRIGSTVRESNQRELMRMFQDSALLHFEVLPTSAGFADLDRSLVIEHFRDYRNINLEMFAEEEFKRALINSSIMDEQDRLTVVGCLLFSRRPERFYAGAGVSFAVIDGNDAADPLVEVKPLNGPVFDCLEKLFSLIRAYNSSKIIGIGEHGSRMEVHEYPFKVIREIIINAFIHRDYAIEGNQIRCFWYRDFLEVRSPGLIPNFLTVEKMKMGVNYYRNPVFMSYFYDRGLIERLGRGIRMVFAEMQRHNKTIPQIEEQGGEVVVRIEKKRL